MESTFRSLYTHPLERNGSANKNMSCIGFWVHTRNLWTSLRKVNEAPLDVCASSRFDRCKRTSIAPSVWVCTRFNAEEACFAHRSIIPTRGLPGMFSPVEPTNESVRENNQYTMTMCKGNERQIFCSKTYTNCIWLRDNQRWCDLITTDRNSLKHILILTHSFKLYGRGKWNGLFTTIMLVVCQTWSTNWQTSQWFGPSAQSLFNLMSTAGQHSWVATTVLDNWSHKIDRDS